MGENDALGPQGGSAETSSDIVLDLSSCVSRYGPPPAVKEALTQLDVDAVWHHPWAAGDVVVRAFARHLGVAARELAPVRGASGAIVNLHASGLRAAVVAPRPAYTEYVRYFPDGVTGPPAWKYDLETIEGLMAEGRAVLISNPHNPSGDLLAADDLIAIARAHRQGSLIVDESYQGFLASSSALRSVIGCEPDNVVAICSATKFYGVAGLRVGVVWSRSALLRAGLAPMHHNWPVSAIEAELTAVALSQTEWASEMRRQMADDRGWLLAALGVEPVVDPCANFALYRGHEASELSDVLLAAGIRVRELGEPHGLPGRALRITAPALHERSVFSRALADGRARPWAIPSSTSL